MPEFELPEPASGLRWGSHALDGKDVVAVFFICNHCPHSRAWEDRLLGLAREFGDRVGSVFISSSDPARFPEDGPQEIADHARALEFPAPYLLDADQSVADAFAAVRTPHAFLFDRGRGLVYRGTVDDDEEDPGAVTRHYLRDAVEEVLAGKSVTTPETPLQGCGIKRRSDPGPQPR